MSIYAATRYIEPKLWSRSKSKSKKNCWTLKHASIQVSSKRAGSLHSALNIISQNISYEMREEAKGKIYTKIHSTNKSNCSSSITAFKSVRPPSLTLSLSGSLCSPLIYLCRLFGAIFFHFACLNRVHYCRIHLCIIKPFNAWLPICHFALR